MSHLFSIDLYDEEAKGWYVLEHHRGQGSLPAFVFKDLDLAIEHLTMILLDEKTRVGGRLRIGFWRQCTKMDHGYHTADQKKWEAFGEVSLEDQITWAKSNFEFQRAKLKSADQS